MKSAKRGSKRDQTLRRVTHGWDDAHEHLSQCRVTDYYTCEKKATCEMYCLHLPSVAADCHQL